MTQFLEIINLLSNPTAILPNSEQQKLVHEFERIKESETGWKECVQLLISDQSLNDQTKFFCMQVIENYLKTRYKTSAVSQDDQAILRSFMSFWLQTQVHRKANEKNFLNKKSAQLFALVSLIDFPNRWQTFFNDLMVTCQWSVGNADFYLKCLMAIDSEIVDREIPHTPEELNIITFYKDSIRKECMKELVESWFLLLKEHSTKNPEITCQTLEVIGAYVSWIEINLIVNSRFLEFFSFALSNGDLRETACSCLEEIIHKGMEIDAKLKLIDYLWSNVIHQNALLLEQQINLNNDDQDNCDYLLKFGKLLNEIGSNLYLGWQKASKKEPELAAELARSIQDKVPFALRLLNHTDDDISECVSKYCMNYIGVLKINKIQTREQQANIESMLSIVINKMKYDPSFNFDSEGEDEAMFLEFRKNIKLVFDSICQLDNDFGLTTVKNLVIECATNWRMKTFIEIENVLHLLYCLGEALPCAQGNHFHPRTTKSDLLCEMIQATVTSNLVECPHRIVKLQYFENLARYYRFFQLYPQLIETVVDHFIGVHGLHNTDPKLRSRVSYLFSRFTKDLRNYLSNLVEKILNSVQDLIVIWSPLQCAPNTPIPILEQEQKIHSSDDQLFLYETVSLLIVTSQSDPKLKAQLMKYLLTPIISSFMSLLNKYVETNDEKLKLIYANSLNMAMSIATRVSKGFSNAIKIKDCECTDIFLEILRIFIQAININTHKHLIHSGVRQYLHRMLICLDNELFEYVPVCIEHFMKQANEPKDIQDLIPLLNKVMAKYKLQIVGFMQGVLMQFTNIVLNFVNSLPVEIGSQILKISTSQIQQFNLQQPLNIQSILPHVQTYFVEDENSDITPDTQLILDIQFMYKTYFQFLLNIVNNDLMDIIAAQSTNDIYKIYFTLLQGAQLGQPDTSKACFQCIRKFITVFVNKPEMGNFVNYTIENAVPCCLEMLFKQTIDLNDAQQILVLNEMAQCVILLYTKFGDEFIKYLEVSYLPNFNPSPQIVHALFEVIKTNNPKGIKTIKEMIQPKPKKQVLVVNQE